MFFYVISVLISYAIQIKLLNDYMRQTLSYLYFYRDAGWDERCLLSGYFEIRVLCEVPLCLCRLTYALSPDLAVSMAAGRPTLN